MYYTVQVYDEFSIKYVDNYTNTLMEMKSHKKVSLDSLKKILSNFFDCYLDPKTHEISIPDLSTAYEISGNNAIRFIAYYTKQKEMYNDLLQKISELKEGSDRLEYEIPKEFLVFEEKDVDKKIVRSIIYIIPFIENNETTEGE